MMSPGAQGEGNDGEDVSLAKSSQRNPHELHNVFGPSGPLRRCAVVLELQFAQEKSSRLRLASSIGAAGSTKQNISLVRAIIHSRPPR